MRSYTGIVAEGSKRAAALGFPTLNIALGDSSVSGIYAARVKAGGKEYTAAAFADQRRKILEAHLLDFSGNLYGKEVAITLCRKIRDNKIFADDEELREAIASDAKAVREYFNL